MEGPFSFTGDGTLPVLDLQCTRLLGQNEQTSRVVSTGEAMYVVADGQTTAVPGNATGGLRLGDAARDLRQQVKRSEMVVEVGKDDLPRSDRATVDFGDDLPPKLTEVLGPYASARISLTLAIARLAEPLRVAAPTRHRRG